MPQSQVENGAPFLDALIRPRAVALVGASDNPKATPARPLRYLRAHGYSGTVYPVNPRRGTVLGERAWPALSDIPGPVDHVYIVVGTDLAEKAVEEAAAAGARVVTVLADGFAETGAEGAERQRRLAETARAAGMRLLGPNSMGVISCNARTALSVNAALDTDRLLPGRIMALSQSGSLIGTLLSRAQARGIGWSSLISVGNEADLGVGSIGLAAVEEEDVDGFVLFLETLRDREGLRAFGEAAAAAGKPVLAYKLGRSDAGRELAVSHTGALVGSDAAADRFLEDAGIVRLEQFEALFESPSLFRHRKPSMLRPDRPVAVVTTTGGGGAMVVDRLGSLGITVDGPSPELRARFAEDGIRISAGRLTDVTLAGARYETMMTVLKGLLDSGEFSAVVAVVGSSAQFHPDLAVQPIVDLAGHPTPLAAFMVPQADASLAALAAAGVPAFRTAESCADGLAALLRWKTPRTMPDTARPALGLPSGGGVLDEARSSELLTALGIPVVTSALIPVDGEVPEETTDRLAWPVAAKILSQDIPHKTEAGGVVLDIADRNGLLAARDRIVESVRRKMPDAALSGIMVQPMMHGVAEALVGYRVDPEAGPVVTLATGGRLAELWQDASLRTAPVTRDEAAAMIGEVRGLSPVLGYRGLPPGDAAALAAAIAALSTLANEPGVMEAEINPLIVRAAGDGVLAVDGLVQLTTTPSVDT